MKRAFRFSPLLALLVSACAAGSQADHDATRGAGADANGFLLIGSADENARTAMFFVTRSFGLTLVRSDGRSVSITRQGCDTLKGLFSNQSCASDKVIAEQLVELPAGDWQIASVQEVISRGFPARNDTIDSKLPPGIMIHVGAGEVVYAGDFLFSLNPDTLEGTLKTYSRDDAAATLALSAYPRLADGGFVYREPTHPISGGS